MGNLDSKQVIKCEECSQKRKTRNPGIWNLIWRSHCLILQKIPSHGEISTWENVIMFLKSHRRAIKSSLARVGEMASLGKPTAGKGIFIHEENTGFATPVQEYIRAKHCIFMLKVSAIWSRIAFSVLDKTACRCSVEYSWRVLRIRVGCQARAGTNLNTLKGCWRVTGDITDLPGDIFSPLRHRASAGIRYRCIYTIYYCL